MFTDIDYPNRTLCEMLKDLRKILSVSNLSVREKNVILSLVEEIQIAGNRMEAGLGDKHDMRYYTEERSKLRKEVNKLKKQKKELGGDHE